MLNIGPRALSLRTAKDRKIHNPNLSEVVTWLDITIEMVTDVHYSVSARYLMGCGQG